MDWEELLDVEDEWEQIRQPSDLGPIRTPKYLAARQRRIVRLRQEIEAGDYQIPAEKVAWHVLYGRCRWGEALIDDEGRRVDECAG